MYYKKLIDSMTLEEKASLCSGKNMWETQDIKRLNIPSITMTDGPYGMVKREFGFSKVIPSTCFPTPSAMASSWDTDLVYSIGKAIGEECKSQNVRILLGPSVNIQRSPLGGRNFEYYSEDPILSGEIGSAFIKGLQSKGIAACVKHYAANNQETKRYIVNNVIESRALNEIYLRNFEIIKKKSNPLVVMAAYNKLNGTYCTENEFLLTKILRNTWGFDGFVVSDWYAVNSILDSIKAGLDLEMPSSNGISSQKIVEAVKSGNLDEAVLNRAVNNILNVIFKVTKNHKANTTYNKYKHNSLARKAASDCIVLLKNEDNILPLDKKKLKNKKLAIIGEYAKKPRYQGLGSAHVNPTMIENAYDEIEKLVGNTINIYYSDGYNTEKNTYDKLLLDKAKKVAKLADIAIIFAGTPESYDQEDQDRSDIKLPYDQINLIEEISKVQKNIIVVLYNGSPVEISPWGHYAKGIIEGWLTGQASGGAICDILFGKVNPSGKLSCTFPIKLSDNPTYLDYINQENDLYYSEGLFVGYRYYDKKNINVEFPFGFGLSYTSFYYSDLSLSKNVINEDDILKISLKVKNTGMYFGKEILQLYVKRLANDIKAPVKELKTFSKLSLSPKEEKEVTFTLTKKDFSYFDTITETWIVKSAPFQILIGKSSRDICLIGDLYFKANYIPKEIYTRETLAKNFLSNPKTKEIVESLITTSAASITSDKESQNTFINYFKNFPIGRFLTISKGSFTKEMLNNLLSLANT